jgi:hypothetical protein
MESEGRRTLARRWCELRMASFHRICRLAVLTALPYPLLSQAWLSAKDQGTVSLLYQYGFDRYHAMSQGEAVDRGHMRLQALMLDVDYSLTDRLAVRVAAPFIEGTYHGAEPHLLVRGQKDTAVALDNGRYHGGLQDLRFDVRYNVSRNRLMVTPFFLFSTPSHSYPTLGHAAIGTNQREYRAGVNVGRQLNPWLPRAYIQGRYAFGVVQEVAHVTPKRSYAEFQFGYVLSRHVSVQASTVWTHSHNGIDFLNGLFPGNLTEEYYLNHDRISKISLLDLGASLSYSINRKTNVFVGWGRSIAGANTHLRAIVLTTGVTRTFTGRTHEEKASALPSTESRRTLVCTCAKSK